MTPAFGARLRAAMDQHGPVCAGIDPHGALLDAWGLPRSAAGAEEFGLRCVEGFAGSVAAVKPQSAFFEVYGAAGVAALERVVAAARAAGLIVVLDVKRGDIGTTMAAYAQAFLADDAPCAVDAITVSPYLGYGSLRPAIDLALSTGRGVFALCLTSNPEGASIQHARAGDSVAGSVAAGAAADNRGAVPMGSVGLVVGATVGDAVERLGLDLAAVNGPFLAPGLGAQGGTVADVRRVFGAAAGQVLASSSRDLLGAGPEPAALREAAVRASGQLALALST